ncbi:hypothetical protein ACHAXH_000525, partial [Discostella pseudostelligera]
MDIINIIDDDAEDEEEYQELPDVLVGSGAYQIVGIRYYTGVAHPGEFVNLIREPNNPYDKNAIRVENLHGEKVGHIKATMAKHLATVMDRQRVIRIQGTIPREGNEYTLPLALDFYSIMSTDDQARISAQNLNNALKGDYNFHLRPEFSASASSKALAPAPTVSVVTKKLDWNAQQVALDELFDVALKKQYENLPIIAMPDCLQNITLMEHQIKGIKWLVKRETEASPPPFYKSVREKGNAMYLCEITQSSQPQPPKPIRGSILADEMGLGKSVQTIGLILLAPPAGVKYEAPTKPASATDAPVPQNPYSKSRCTLIVCPVSVMSNWTDQVSQFVTPGVLTVKIYHGANRHAVLTEVKSGNVDILLVSYNTLAADYDASGQGAEHKTKK